MARKSLNNLAKLGAVGLAACAVCCAPLVLTAVVGVSGTAALGLGQWVVGGLLLAAAIGYAMWRRRKACNCSGSCPTE